MSDTQYALRRVLAARDLFRLEDFDHVSFLEIVEIVHQDPALEERDVDFVEYAGWEAIDAAERVAGEPLGRPRVKLGTWHHLLEAAKRITP